MKDFEEFKRASSSGITIMNELMKFDNPDTFRSIIAASIDTWCHHKGYDALEVIASIDDAMHFAHKEDDE